MTESEPESPSPRSSRPAAAEVIPGDVRRLIERHVASGAQLEALLLLHATPERPWNAVRLSRELRIDTDQAQQMLDRLTSNGFLQQLDQHYRFNPRREALAATVDRLAALYPAYRVAILAIVFGRATGPIRDFSEAFILRPDPRER